MKRAILILTGLLTLASSAQAELITIDFNEDFTLSQWTDRFGPNGCETSHLACRHGYQTYVENGVAITPAALVQTNWSRNTFNSGSLVSVERNGTGLMSANASFSITANDDPFSLRSMDLLMGNLNGFPGATGVTFEAYRDGSLTGTMTVPLNWHNPQSNLPRPEGLPIGWTNPTFDSLGVMDELRVSPIARTEGPWFGGTTIPGEWREFWVDNITIETQQVPEPSSLLLIGLGALGLWHRRRRL